MIAIIDYGMGNLASVRNALLKLGMESFLTSDPDQVLSAERVILPGVGAFADAIHNLRHIGMDKALKEVVSQGIPLLGVCLGMQLLFSESYENGIHQGLDIVKGRVEKLPPIYKVPHMGWNEILPRPQSRLFKNIKPNTHFYFVHSYYVIPEEGSWVAATSNHGIDFVCALEKENVFATQFHPEKSSDLGLRVLKNFGEIKR
ncbi:MAG: imidazole glycerol phosphate synthase subunit HisH [Syntrophomonadaceae bacterium]